MLLNKNVTFSGSDTLVFIILPNTAPIVLGSITTFSYSSYRAKKPVQTLGSILTKGVAKGSRIIAGTMVFTILNKHWVNELISVVPWLREACHRVVYSDELPLFDLLIVSANEYGRHVSMRIQGVDITDEAGTLSVNDIYSENTFSFIAREIATFDNDKVQASDLKYKSHKMFNEFNTINFGGGDVYDKVWNKKLLPSETDVERVRNIMMEMEPTKFDKIINNLTDIGFKFDDITNRSLPVANLAIAVANRLYDDREINIDDFVNFELPYIQKEFYEEESFFEINRGSASSFSSSSMGEVNEEFGKDEHIVVLGSFTNEFGDLMHYTSNGYFSDSDLSNTINESLRAEVYVNGDPVSDNTIVSGDFNVTVNDLSIVIDSGNSYKRVVTNAMGIKGDEVLNTLREEIIAGETVIDFKDRLEELNGFNPKEINLIVKAIEEDFHIVVKIRGKS